MPRKRRSSSPFDICDDDFDDDNSQSSQHLPVQRNAANARERARMRVLSSAFGRLKTKLPNIPPDTKLSKLDTLRLATIYIKQLKAAVDNGNTDYYEGSSSSSQNHQNGGHNMSWPFGFHNSPNNNRQHTFPCFALDWNQSDQNVTKSPQMEISYETQQPIATHWYGNTQSFDILSPTSCHYENKATFNSGIRSYPPHLHLPEYHQTGHNQIQNVPQQIHQ